MKLRARQLYCDSSTAEMAIWIGHFAIADCAYGRCTIHGLTMRDYRRPFDQSSGPGRPYMTRLPEDLPVISLPPEDDA
jgi:hypothetical protein